MKIYVMQKGQYSDRHVIGVTDNKDKAIKICDMIDANWSEWDTDQFNLPNVMRFTVSNPYNSYTNEWLAEFDDYDIYDEYKDNSVVYDGYYVVYADSPNTAIKIAQDMEAQIKAERAGL